MYNNDTALRHLKETSEEFANSVGGAIAHLAVEAAARMNGATEYVSLFEAQSIKTTAITPPQSLVEAVRADGDIAAVNFIHLRTAAELILQKPAT